jgi:hypothetical protein
VEKSRATNRRQTVPEENSNAQPKKKTTHTMATERSANCSRRQNRPRMAYSIKMMMMMMMMMIMMMIMTVMMNIQLSLDEFQV